MWADTGQTFATQEKQLVLSSTRTPRSALSKSQEYTTRRRKEKSTIFAVVKMLVMILCNDTSARLRRYGRTQEKLLALKFVYRDIVTQCRAYEYFFLRLWQIAAESLFS